MMHLATSNGNKSAVVYCNGKEAIASFPAKLNAGRIPSLDDAAEVVATKWPIRTTNNSTLPAIDSGKKDGKGRPIGFIVYVYQWIATGDWYASVQNARLVKGQWKNFGVGQRAKKYATEDDAKRNALVIARVRAA